MIVRQSWATATRLFTLLRVLPVSSCEAECRTFQFAPETEKVPAQYDGTEQINSVAVLHVLLGLAIFVLCILVFVLCVLCLDIIFTMYCILLARLCVCHIHLLKAIYLTWLVHQLELRALSSYPVWVRTPPPLKQIFSLLKKDHQLPLRRSTCFDNQLTRPVHANLLLQHVTGGIHTKKLK